MRILAALALLTLAACASSPSRMAAERLVVQAATMKVIEADADRAAKAARVIAAVSEARVLVDTDGVTLAEIQAAVMRRLAERGLEPSDMLLATALVDVVGLELQGRIGDGLLDPEKRVTVNTFLAWIEQAAHFYV